MSSTFHMDMHREHTNWRMEDDFWRDEMAVWEGEIDRAIADVPGLDKVLHDHAQLLRKHAASIRLYEQEFAAHEHALVGYEAGYVPQELLELTQSHMREAEKQAEQRKSHEMIKRQHHALMAKWNLLSSVIAKPGSNPSAQQLTLRGEI